MKYHLVTDAEIMAAVKRRQFLHVGFPSPNVMESPMKKPTKAQRAANLKRAKKAVAKAKKPKARKPAKKVKKLRPRPFQLNWSTRDQTTAEKEGWGVFLHPKRKLEIERVDKPRAKPLHVFATDAEAYWYVAFRAARGSGLHIRALEEIREHNFHRYPREIGAELGLPHPHELPPLADRPDADIYQTRRK